MTRRSASIVLSAILLLPLAGGTAIPQTRREMREEAAEHPRIAKAIRELEDAIAYMEHAPHDFGGHRAAAIAASKEAIVQLKTALAYRARRD